MCPVVFGEALVKERHQQTNVTHLENISLPFLAALVAHQSVQQSLGHRRSGLTVDLF